MGSQNIKTIVMEFSLLQHPFYQAWNEGKLSMEVLRNYSCQYWHHERAFPKCISATHSQCDDLKSRQKLLENLMDEEKGKKNHSELWLRFAEGIGATREQVINSIMNNETKELVNGFTSLSKQSYEHGLGLIFSYECQIPEVAKTKIQGLKKFYNISDTRTLEFFQTHLKVDDWHTEQCSNLIDQVVPENMHKVKEGAEIGAKLLWNFLNGTYKDNC